MRRYAANALKRNIKFIFCACNRNPGSSKLVKSRQRRTNMGSHDFRRQLAGYGLTTAQILYRLPDHPNLLQTYVWQDYDLCPKFPVLNKFLAFWLKTLEGPLHSVTVAHARLIKPAEIRAIHGEFRLQ